MDGHEEVEMCSICLGPFKNPRSLPCHHYFCTKCLQNCINHLPTNPFRCPYCRSHAAPEDECLPLNRWSKGFPIVNTYTKEENPNPFFCVDCMGNNLYIDAVGVSLKHGKRLCYGCSHDSKEGVFFCINCCTFSYAQCYASKHAVCKEENAVKPIPVAAKEMREKMESVIENTENLIEECDHMMHHLSNLSQKWQHVDFETMVLFSMDENIQENYTQHLATLDEMLRAIQYLSTDIFDDLEIKKGLQKIEDDFQYLKIKSLHDNEELLNYKNRLAKIAEKTKIEVLAFQALEKILIKSVLLTQEAPKF